MVAWYDVTAPASRRGRRTGDLILENGVHSVRSREYGSVAETIQICGSAHGAEGVSFAFSYPGGKRWAYAAALAGFAQFGHEEGHLAGPLRCGRGDGVEEHA